MDSSVFGLTDNVKLYAVLRVEKTASDGEIKRAYHKLAMQFHPDKNPTGGDMFKEIGFAYQILSDPEQRRMYDAQTLRKHVHSKAREYDPMMDPNVDLTPEQLSAFIERIRSEEASKKLRQQEFAKRRQEELTRQAEFDALHPDFKMPPLPQPERASASESAFRTTAELTAALSDALENVGNDRRGGEALNGLGRHSACDPASRKAQMLEEFRRQRTAAGMSTTEYVEPKPEVKKSVSGDHRLRDLVNESANSYVKQVSTTRKQRSNFDYCDFVIRGYHDGGVVGDAVLADALADYDPNN